MLSRRQKSITGKFTVVETVTLTVWALLVYIAFTAGTLLGVLFWSIVAALELFAGLYIEHTMAGTVGDFPLDGAIHPQSVSIVAPITFTRLKLSRAAFAFLIVFVNSLATLIQGLILLYAPAALTVLLVGFIQAVCNGLIVLLATEQAVAPPAGSPA